MWFLHDREGAVLSNSQEEGMMACDFYSPARTSLPDMNKLSCRESCDARPSGGTVRSRALLIRRYLVF